MSDNAPSWQVDYGYLDEIEQATGLNVAGCYQCRKCSNGCPVSDWMDLKPHEIVRLIILGAKDRVENSRTLWICASCQTCYSRCPNDIYIPQIMDYLKQKLVDSGAKAPEPNTKLFHESFLNEVRKRGRVFEGGLMQNYYMKSGQMFKLDTLVQNAKLGLAMFKKGRLALTPPKIKGSGEVKKIFEETKGDR